MAALNAYYEDKSAKTFKEEGKSQFVSIILMRILSSSQLLEVGQREDLFHIACRDNKNP